MFYEDRGRVLNTYYSNGELKENLSRAKVSNALASQPYNAKSAVFGCYRNLSGVKPRQVNRG